jgi:Fic family protein
MNDDAPDPLTPDEVVSIDAEYVPFPRFLDWPSLVSRAEAWEASRQRLQKLAAEASSADLKKAQEIAFRTAAFDTGAIEGLYSTDRGLTFTVATQAAAWEQTVETRDAIALDLFRAQLEAFELVLDLATDLFPEITQAWIRRVHEVVTAAQDTYEVRTPIGIQERPLPKGRYKEDPNHVLGEDGTVHAYAPVEMTQPEMERLLDELNTEGFREAHPVLQASYVHYGLAAIHPFADGNGRVARAVASAYIYRGASVPLLVMAHQRDRYLSALAMADAGERAPFIAFISDASREGIEMVVETVLTAQGPQPDDLLKELKGLYLAKGDLTHQQLDEIAERFADELLSTIDQQVRSLSFPDGVSVEVIPGSGANHGEIPPGFRKVVSTGGRYVVLKLQSAAPAIAEASRNFDLLVSTSPDPASTLLLRVNDSDDSLILGLDDLQPDLSAAGRVKTSSFVQRILADVLRELLGKARRRLRRVGYEEPPA